jgi:hypothetical protein
LGVFNDELYGLIIIPAIPSQSESNAGKGRFSQEVAGGIETNGIHRFMRLSVTLCQHHFAMVISNDF